MNEIKYDLEKKIDGSKTYRGQNPKFVNNSKQFNFPNSPKNKSMKFLNLGNINTNKISKYISNKNNSSSKIIADNIKRAYEQNSTNNIMNNKINKKEKELYNNERIFQKGVFNEKLESLLFKNKLKSKNINNNNKLLSPKNKIFTNINNTTARLKLNPENKINLNSFIEAKFQPLISKFANKRSSSVINANKANEKLKEINNLTYKESLFMTKYNNDNEKIKMVKTPTKKIVIESDKKIKQNNSINKNKIELEENHFKAVLYNQEIKKLKKNLN